MNSHFHLPKIHTIGDELTLSLAKNSHFSFLPSHFPSLPSRRGHHCGAEICNEFTLSIAKIFFALFVPPLSNGTSRTTSDRKEAQWPIGYGVGLRIKRSSVRIRPWPLRWVLGQGSLLPLSQGEAFTLASISYLAILVKYILAKKKKKKKKKPKTNDQILPSPILFFPSKNWIKNYWK